MLGALRLFCCRAREIGARFTADGECNAGGLVCWASSRIGISKKEEAFVKIRRREMLLSFLAIAEGNSFGDAMLSSQYCFCGSFLV